jgi:hypothetical protein
MTLEKLADDKASDRSRRILMVVPAKDRKPGETAFLFENEERGGILIRSKK